MEEWTDGFESKLPSLSNRQTRCGLPESLSVTIAYSQAIDVHFWPSDYSGMIVQYLLAHGGPLQGHRVCDIGTGSGILVATALKLGALDVVATDIDPIALDIARGRLSLGFPDVEPELHLGSNWDSLDAKRQFDLVLANLPNFPAVALQSEARSKHWSVGGVDGRAALDPFLEELPARLAMGGLAVFTQNRCIGLDITLRQLRNAGLSVRVEGTTLVPINPNKIDALSPVSNEPDGIVTIAGFTFLEVALVVASRTVAMSVPPTIHSEPAS